jgi:phosphonopyruvate decarboxylase
VLLLIGWRGEPGVKDEPQHVKQGKNMLAILDAVGIPHDILPPDPEGARKVVAKAKVHMTENLSPYAIIVRKGTFDAYKLKKVFASEFTLKREEAIELILENIERDAVVVSTTGMISREVFECRERSQAGHRCDFLTVGSMGHACQIALGIALEREKRPVYCLDGDGALLMHMGSAAVLASMAPKNLTHIILNNGAHDSVGGQPTIGFQINLPQFAASVGYKEAATTSVAEEVPVWIKRLTKLDGPKLLEICVARGARADLGRPTTTPKDNKIALMRYLSDGSD